MVPQDAAPWSLQVLVGSGWPLGTLLHVPASAADTLHDLQVPLQFVEQQTPWLQKPDLHSLPAEQVRPGSFNPHELFAQVLGDEQALMLEQAALQAPEPHRNGEHELEPGFTHLPEPSQVDLPVNVVVPLGQVASAQVVPFAYFWQAPAWHLPFVPQLAAPWSLHMPAGSELPVGTFVHAPRLPDRLQAWQAPLQAELQQTPCAQNPLLHWLLDEQVAPLLDGPHEFAEQRFGVRHCVSAVHEMKHLLPLQT